MTTGAALPLNHKALALVISGMQDHQRRFGVEPRDHERTALLIRACLLSGTSRQITYATPGDEKGASSLASPPVPASKIGRNDPCPCGSGRKHKKCCGA